MARNTENVAASVHQRLLNKARESSRPFNELLQHFAIERFIYRLSKDRYADRFILKGALMFSTWSGAATRPTMDIDLSARIDNSLEAVVATIRDACRRRVEMDGMSFDPKTVTAARISEGAEYEGVRARVRGHLGNARISLQIDIGFGDVIVPGPNKIIYPVLLDFPPPELNGYTKESTIAEKFQAMVKLGVLNTRMKDFYDIWMFSRLFDFKGEVLAEAVEKTFANRKTQFAASPTFDLPFMQVRPDKETQWRAFLGKAKLSEPRITFEDAVAAIETFLRPVVDALAEKRAFGKTWNVAGPAAAPEVQLQIREQVQTGEADQGSGLTRSFDQRSHTYQGYVLHIDGEIGDEERELIVAVGERPEISQQEVWLSSKGKSSCRWTVTDKTVNKAIIWYGRMHHCPDG